MKLEWNPNPGDSLKFCSMEEFKKQHPSLFMDSILAQDDEKIRFCRIIDFNNVLSGTFLIPAKTRPIESHIAFAFCLSNHVLYLIGSGDRPRLLVEQFKEHYDTVYTSAISFLVGLMLFIVHDDVYYLEQYNLDLEQIEEDLFANNQVGMEAFTITARKDMEILSSYYLQLSTAAETLQKILVEENEDSQTVNALLNLFITKCNQLRGTVETIKSFTNQIWNLRQTQLSDKQNKITTVLTIITTIFLPLTLITGWFGMNFQNLPLIYTSSGYAIIFILCVVIISLELIFIWNKHLFK